MKAERVYVLGVSGSGKSTLARKIAKKLKCEHYDLDDFYYRRRYDDVRTHKEIIRMVEKVIRKRKWVIEGSYSSAKWVKMIRNKADMVVWLDLPAHILSWRIIKRGLTRETPEGHSRIKDIFELLDFVRRYKTEKKSTRHRHMNLTTRHKQGVVLKSMEEVDSFLKNFK